MALGIFDIVFKVTGAGDAVQSLKNIKTEAKSTADGLDKTKQSTDALGKQFQGLLAGAAVAGFAKGAIYPIPLLVAKGKTLDGLAVGSKVSIDEESRGKSLDAFLIN